MKRMLLLLLFPWCAWGMDGMTALSMVESGHNDRAVGRAGEISRYQVMKREWHAVTKSRAYTNPQVAAEVTRKILDSRIKRFQEKRGRMPSNFDIYVLWNAPSQAYKGRVSRVVAERARRYANLCGPDLAVETGKLLASSTR